MSSVALFLAHSVAKFSLGKFSPNQSPGKSFHYLVRLNQIWNIITLLRWILYQNRIPFSAKSIVKLLYSNLFRQSLADAILNVTPAENINSSLADAILNVTSAEKYQFTRIKMTSSDELLFGQDFCTQREIFF